MFFSDIYFWIGQAQLSKWSHGVLWPFINRNAREKDALQGDDSSWSWFSSHLRSVHRWLMRQWLERNGSQRPWRRGGWKDLLRHMRKGIHSSNKQCSPQQMLAVSLQVLRSMSPFSLGNSGPCLVLWWDIRHQDTHKNKITKE